MNPGFQDLAAGAFESGLAKLDADPEWHDDRPDLDGPFRLGFPGARGWGEELLVASLLKRHAHASKGQVQVFASEQVCSILKHDPAFLPYLGEDDTKRRSPLAVLRHALVGKLLDAPFVPLTSPCRTTAPNMGRRPCAGIAWASVGNSRTIREKSVPVEQFLDALTGIDADLISLQRKLSVADPHGLAAKRGVHLVEHESLDATTPAVEALVGEILGLDFLVTISTTTTHIAAAMGTRVELIVAEREGPQWFWRVQASHGKYLYPTVRLHLGDGRKEDWWERSLQSVRASLSREKGSW